MTFLRRLMTFAALAGMASLSLASCGQAQPTVCAQAEELQGSVRQLQDTNLREQGLGSLTTALTQVSTELNELTAEASNQFTPQIAAVRSAVDQVQAQLTAAKTDPSAAAIGQVGVALGGLQNSVEDRGNGIAATC